MRPRVLTWSFLCLLVAGFANVAKAGAPPPAASVIVLEVAGTVEIMPRGATRWILCATNQSLAPGDQLRTGPRSRAAIRLSNLTVFRMGEQAYLRIREEQRRRSALDIIKGVFYFFHRDNPGEYDFQTPTVSAAVRGTEFHIEVLENGATTLTVLEGEVEMENEHGDLQLKSGEQGRAEPGQRPHKTAQFSTESIIQWSLYYPGVLDIDELGLSAAEQDALKDSLAAYRSGDLLDALAKYPAGRVPASDREQVYLRALLLAVGQVSDAAAQRKQAAGETAPFHAAIDKVIGVVQSPTHAKPTNSPSKTKGPEPRLATEWMAESIYLQSRHDLTAALDAARHATDKSPRFGFAWERVAELEFGFGRIRAAKRALQQSLDLSPRNAQALALMGFLLAAENRIDEAIPWFDRAIAVDAALGNAWLGRGLSKIRRGDAEAGRADIQVAATVEPQRAAFRSYLGKAFSHVGDNRRATNELALAKELDPNDPTAWLYSALIKQQENRINEAVKDFEHAQDLADNRAVYRSRLLLDQDRAVSGVNLATIYQDAGMTDVSVREASRAVAADYSVHSSHLFLANSYNAQRDARQVNLRYETPAVSEYLVANLLAPVGAGILSPHVTQQEYSKLFERDRAGVSSTTEYLSRGDWFQAASIYGTLRNTSFAIDVEYRSQNGQRVNNDLEQFARSAKVKQQITPSDSVFLQAVVSETESGDLRQLYSPNSADPLLRVKETQQPLLLLGYHHEWSPSSHTLFLGGRLQDTLRVTDPFQEALLFARSTNGNIIAAPYAFQNPSAGVPTADFRYRSDFDAYTAELQQIVKFAFPVIPGDHTLVVGGRFQTGTFDTGSELGNTMPLAQLGRSNAPPTPPLFAAQAKSTSVEEDFGRIAAYAYDHWQVHEQIMFVAGVTYDWLEYPRNFRYSPLSRGQVQTDKLSPKVGVIWTPRRDTVFRAAYSRSLAGVSFDQSFQLEPSQVAGFNQSYRSLIPESVAGAIAGAEFETFGVSFDQKFETGTYIGAQAELLKSTASRQIGIQSFTNASVFDPNYDSMFRVDSTPQELDYEERTVLFTFNQLVGRHLSLGARYRFSQADLETHLTEVSPILAPLAHQDVRAFLHQANLFALVNHPSGLFGHIESIWSQQSNQGYTPDLPGDDFWQFNVFAGYRFPRRHAELRVGLLNITDQDYQLNPLNLTAELPRDRTLYVSLRFHF